MNPTSPLNISTSPGPRPLHLLDRNVPSQAQSHQGQPSFSPSSEVSTPSKSRGPHPIRRQSSISYYARDGDAVLSPPGSLTRGISSVEHKSLQLTGSRTGSPIVATEKRRQPHTLTEKYAELLHFIAQKESQCLELRSQLAAHEAELLQLKQKWERIVNCGFDKTNSQDDNLTSPTATNQGGVVLEGIKEGVQGVSRFIAAGLGEFSSSALSSPSRKHVVHQSCSSISTYATKSTRFSQSSASSLGDDPHSLPDSPSKEHVQVLMVHDTGATPTMSPNFTFAHQQQEMKTQQEHPDGGFESDAGSEREAKLQRRKSREGTTSRLPSRTTVSNSNDFVRGDVANRTRVYGNKSAGLPPASSIPGLGSLAVGAPAPSWVESVGRRWEELQKGSTFSKNQKRASLLLSDVSQTIVLALSSPPFPTPPSSNPQTSQSLLDDDDNPLDSMTSVLKPDLSATHSTSEARGGSLSPQDFDEDWNW